MEVVGGEQGGVGREEGEACRVCVQLLVETGITADLKERLVASAREYFAGRAAEWMGEAEGGEGGGGMGRYLRSVEAALLWEEEMVRGLELGKAVGEDTLVAGIRELVQRHGEGVVGRREGGCAWLLQQKKHEELGLMYRLFKREALAVAATQAAAAAAAAAAANEAARKAAAAAMVATAAAGERAGRGGDNPPSTPPHNVFLPSVSVSPPLPPPSTPLSRQSEHGRTHFLVRSLPLRPFFPPSLLLLLLLLLLLFLLLSHLLLPL